MTTKRMVTIDYALPGDADYQSRLYPPVSVVQPAKGSSIHKDPPKTTAAIIEHFTKSSLDTDGIVFRAGSLRAYQDASGQLCSGSR